MKNLRKTLAALFAAAMTMALIVIPASAETVGASSFTPPGDTWKNSGSGEIQIGIGEYSIATPYKSVPIDVAAMIYEDRTYIPVRAVAEALDARVEWDGDVHIYQW